jgi:NAD(P)-dependent dehydrogenase (short-subunit alcohol dehydrogenase family)
MSRPWVLVLGCSSGFGAAICQAFARQGYGILGVHLDRRQRQAEVDALVAGLQAEGVPVCWVNRNAADDDARKASLEAFQAAVGAGQVRVFVHSLAFGTLRPATGDGALTRKQLEMTLDVMSSSLLYWTQDLVRLGLLGRGGRVFAMTSSGSLAAWPAYGAVSAAKASLEAWCRQLAVELAPQGITVNAVMAGVTRTPALEKIPGADLLAERALARNPHGRLTTPADVADCLVALAGPGTAWLTGNVLRVDGGESVAG